MNLQGRRVHIAGSADTEADAGKLQYVHSLLSRLTSALIDEHANFVVPFGKEPFLKDQTAGPSIIFDWTIAETIHKGVQEGRANPSGTNGRLISTVSTSKTSQNVPESRRGLFEELRDKQAISMEVLNPGWTAGALQRQRQARLGDILIVVSGGQGVEQLAIEYSTQGKPVIPLDIHLGASQRDGSGGGARLFERALASPDDFFRVIDGESPAELLDRTRTRDGAEDLEKVVLALMSLLHKLSSPRVFYVRLLNASVPENASVEDFFRNTADPLVKELGYEPLQMGLGKNEFAWMNQAIFDSLHHGALAVVDLTGLRPNCFMELGYALGNRQRVILTARDDTKFPFDAFALEAYLWKESEAPSVRIDKFRTHWERNMNMPTLVRPKEAK